MKKIKPQTQKAKLELIEQKIKELLKENQQIKQENSKLKSYPYLTLNKP